MSFSGSEVLVLKVWVFDTPITCAHKSRNALAFKRFPISTQLHWTKKFSDDVTLTGGLTVLSKHSNEDSSRMSTMLFLTWTSFRGYVLTVCYYWNEYVTIAVNRNLSNCEKARKKGFRGFYGIRTPGLCVSAAVLYQPELWRPIHWRPANLLSSSTRERNETQNEMMWTAIIQLKWVCDHRSESQFNQMRKSPKKRISGLQRDSNPWPLR